MKSFAIIGHPVAHSLSPLMYNTAFSVLGMDCQYEAIDVEPESLAQEIERFRSMGYAGLNATLPHKQSIMAYLDHVEEEALAIGAVNTIVRSDSGLAGYNTDLEGFLRSLEPVRGKLEGSTILVLGAGGSARAVLFGLLRRHSPAHITILNRTVETAERLAQEFEPSNKKVTVRAEMLFDDTLQNWADQASVIINTTSVGMKPFVDASPLEEVSFNKNQFVMDLIYTPLQTKLLKTASEGGAATANGLEMLLEQGAASFRLWTGAEMPLEKVRNTVLERLQ